MSTSGLARWIAPLALMAAIFYLSSLPNLSSGLGLIDLIGRKLVHAGLYGLLCWLWWRALRTVAGPRGALAGALVIAIGYGISDEIHQTFVPTRSGSPLDVIIDALGACLVAFVIHRRSGVGAGAEPRRRPKAPPGEYVR